MTTRLTADEKAIVIHIVEGRIRDLRALAAKRYGSRKNRAWLKDSADERQTILDKLEKIL